MRDSLTIGELSARSGVAPSALRYYESLGLIRAGRTGGNQRRYERAELRRVAFIRIAQRVGVSLDEIGQALDVAARRRARRPRPTGRGCRRAGGAGWTSRSRLLERLRDDLDGCIGCGCLSLQRCRSTTRTTRLAGERPRPAAALVLTAASAGIEQRPCRRGRCDSTSRCASRRLGHRQPAVHRSAGRARLDQRPHLLPYAPTIAAFSSSGRDRSVVAVIAAALGHQRAQIQLGRAPPCRPITTSRPPVASASTLRSR